MFFECSQCVLRHHTTRQHATGAASCRSFWTSTRISWVLSLYPYLSSNMTVEKAKCSGAPTITNSTKTNLEYFVKGKLPQDLQSPRKHNEIHYRNTSDRILFPQLTFATIASNIWFASQYVDDFAIQREPLDWVIQNIIDCYQPTRKEFAHVPILKPWKRRATQNVTI